MIKLLGISLHLYGFILGLAALAGLQASLSLAKHWEIRARFVESGFWWVLVGGLVGARLYHVADLWEEIYRLNPIQIIYLWEGGLGIWGGILGGFLALGLYYQQEIKGKIDFWRFLDVCVFGLPLAQAIGRWGNFINQELYGRPTDLPWAIIDPAGTRVHPLFLYESLLSLGLFVVFVWLTRTRQLGAGVLTGIYLVGYGVIRGFLEPLRPEVIVWQVAGISVAQIFSIIAIGVGVVALVFRRK